MRFVAGTRQPVKNSSDVSAACCPILRSGAPRWKPSALSASTANRRDRLRIGGRDGRVLELDRHDDQVGGLPVGDEGLAGVDDRIRRLRGGRGPSSRARRCPAPGSVMAIAPISVPATIDGSQRLALLLAAVLEYVVG